MARLPLNRHPVLCCSPSASTTGSGVRDVALTEQDTRRAFLRVQEYLRVHGLNDGPRLDALAGEIVAANAGAPDLAAASIAAAQQRWGCFIADVFDTTEDALDPIWLRAFVAAHPLWVLGDVAMARVAARRFGDADVGELPRDARLIEQRFAKVRVQPWLKGLLAPLCLTVSLSALLLLQLATDGLSALELLWGLSFSVVFFLPAVGATTALVGFTAPRESEPSAKSCDPLPRSVVIMPIFHEHVERVFAAVAAIAESLQQTEGGDCFEIFVLSDSRDPQIAADEERAFRRVTALETSPVPIYYRRRADNQAQKAGNVAEFFERFGARYRYAVVLDADSLMTGHALVELVRRIDAAPRVALIQAALQLHASRSLLARTQQLLASVCGPLMQRGLARWSGAHGNYYGHNAIVRISAFIEHCGLPQLSGAPPLGGHFLSHDFVEAALLARGGWEVRSAWDLRESWEEVPQTLDAYVARDRRWCQGNLQHLRIVLAAGLPAMSRIHMALGALSYLAGPALLLFVMLGIAVARDRSQLSSVAVSVTLICATVGCLVLPRVLALIDTARDARRRREHGGLPRLMISMLLEAVVSAWTAPLFLLHHTQIVLAIAFGRAVRWDVQHRGVKRRGASLVRIELPSSVFGALLLAVLWIWAPALTWWLAPLWLPCLCAIPLALAISIPWSDRVARSLGLFMTASETEPHPLLARARDLRVMTISDAAARFRDLVLDPVLLATHLKRLPVSQDADPQINDVYARALRLGPAALSAAECALLAGDAASLRRLHREAWRRWPIESWDLARVHPQTPRAVG